MGDALEINCIDHMPIDIVHIIIIVTYDDICYVIKNISA